MLLIRLFATHRARAPWMAIAMVAVWPALLAATQAQSLPALPDWPDHSTSLSGPSVYLSARVAADGPTSSSTAELSRPSVETPVRSASADVPETKPIAVDEVSAEVVSPPPVFVTREEAAPPSPAAGRDPRRLAPRAERDARTVGGRAGPATSPTRGFEIDLPLDSIYTTCAALAVVVGLFLACAWLVRRGAKKTRADLPDGVVRVLGRVPLAARQFAELVRVGNKLVLLSVTPTGAETLTEVTDPAEVDRLLGLCAQNASHSSTAEFDQVFRQLAAETTPDGFLGREATRDAGPPADDTYSTYRREQERG